MENNYKQSPRFVRARKKVDNIKKFYRHLGIFIVVNGILLVLKFRLFDFFSQQGINDPEFYEWLDWNIIGTPVLWGIVLLFHAIYVFGLNSRSLRDFKPQFIRDWEARTLEKFVREEERNDKWKEQ